MPPAGTVSLYAHLVRTGSRCSAVPARPMFHTALSATEIYAVWKTLFFLRKEHIVGSRLTTRFGGVHLCWSAFMSQADLNLTTKDFSHGGHPERVFSTFGGLSWSVLLLNHKFLWSLVSLVLCWCDSAASPPRHGGASGWVFRCCGGRTVCPGCEEQLALGDSCFF